MCFALFMVMLDNTVVNVALPSIQKDLGASISGLEWTVNAYTLSFAVLLVTGGRLGDIFGRRKMFLFGVVVVRRSRARSSASRRPRPGSSPGARVQGLGAAFMMPATLSIISNAFPPHERGKAIGTWAGVSALALAIGPVVGGFLVEHVSWQSIFFLNLPVAALAVVVTLFAAHESRDESAPRTVDIPGVADAHDRPRPRSSSRSSRATRGAGARRAILGALRARRCGAGGLRARRAAPPRRRWSTSAFFRSRSFLGASLVAFIVSFAMLAMFFFIALYMQNVMGYSPLEAGVRFLPSTS